jgi:hypothetical protein
VQLSDQGVELNVGGSFVRRRWSTGQLRGTGPALENNTQRPSSGTQQPLTCPEELACGGKVPVVVEDVFAAEHRLGMSQCRGTADPELQDDPAPVVGNTDLGVRSESLRRRDAVSEGNLDEGPDESRVLVGRYAGHVRQESRGLPEELPHVQERYGVPDVWKGDLSHEHQRMPRMPHGPHPRVARARPAGR